MADNSAAGGQNAPTSARDAHPHDVFISYSSQNKVVAEAVCHVMELNGVRCWMAPRDITPGAEWAASIIRAINETRAFVLIFSSFANTSLQVKREVERAANRGIPIIPFRLEDIPANETLEFFISTPHWLDALNPPLESHAERLSKVVERLLGDTQPKLARARRRAGSAEAVAEAVEDIDEAAGLAPEAPETASEPPPTPPPRPTVQDTAATIAAAQALAAATPASAQPQAAPGSQAPPQPLMGQAGASPGEAPVSAPLAHSRPPRRPLEPLWTIGIGAVISLVLFFANPSPMAGWGLLILFSFPLVISLYRLSFVKPLKSVGLWFALGIGYLLASLVGASLTNLMTRGLPSVGVGSTFMITGLSAASFAVTSYALLMVLGDRLANGRTLRMAALYTVIVTLAGAVLGAVWAVANPARAAMRAVDILWAAPWLIAYGAGFFAIAGATANPLFSAEGRRNVTEQTDARLDGREVAPNVQSVFLSALGVLFAVFVLALGLAAAAGGTPGAQQGASGATNAADPGAGKDPAQPMQVQPPAAYPPAPTYDNPPAEEPVYQDPNPPLEEPVYDGQGYQGE